MPDAPADSNADPSVLARLLAKLTASRTLPDPLPSDPFPLFAEWFEAQQQAKRIPNPNAMALATIDADGRPSNRIVLCKSYDAASGTLVFHTNYDGRKGRALAAHPHAAACFHWDHDELQVRIEGPVLRVGALESDAYFATRPWEARVGAWASRQSQPLRSRADLTARVLEVIKELGLSLPEIALKGDKVVIPRPPHWGGFRVFAERVELWRGGTGRFHDRAAWVRALSPTPSAEGATGYSATPWTATRLQP